MEGAMGQSKQDKPRAKSAPAKTMMFGMTAPQTNPQPQQPAPAAQAPMAAVQPSAPQPRPAPVDNNKTMLGVPAVVTAQPAPGPPMAKPAPMVKMASPAPAAKAPVSDAEALKAKRTVLGMPAVTAEAVQDLMNKAPAAAPAAAPAPIAQQQAPVSQMTQPLEPTPEVRQRSSIPAPTAPLEPVRKADSPPREEPRSRRPQADPDLDSGYADSWPDDPPSRKRGSKGLVVIAIVAGFAVLAAAGLLVYLLVLRGGPTLKPQVFPSADGENLTVVLTIPDAAQGAQAQVSGQIVPVMAGQARFDLPLSQMSLGENSIQVTVNEPGGTSRQLSFPIVLRHTVKTDLSGLVTAQPFFVVNFQVAQGISLFVEGKPVQLIGGGYAHTVSLSQVPQGDGAGDSLVYKLPFQLTSPDGNSEAGQQNVNIPLTELRLDRPAANAVVALETVSCSGVTEEGATVTVNGAPVGVTTAGFNTSVPLDAIGDHPITVTARAPGKAPRTIAVKVTRIQSLDTAIEEWSADLDRALDYPMLARDPNLHAGKKVKFSGRVVNISTKKGVTAFLLYVGSGCPAGAKCAVYVAFRGETDAGLQSLVDVYGTVRGTWDVDLTGGRKETMPALDATFVVTSDASKKSKKRSR